MKLQELTKDVKILSISGPTDVEVNDLAYDSRKTGDKVAFVALSGFRVDGHDFISQAIEKGSKVIFVEKDVEVPEGITVVKLENTRTDLSKLSRTLFGYPDQEITTITITGTKGKTSTSCMIKNALDKSGNPCGLIGTLGVYYEDKYYQTNNTSPESYDVFKYMREMLDHGVKHIVMEISSQSLKLNRWSNVVFDYALFTNLSLDHVGKDEHESYEDYRECKSRLFKQAKHGIFNADDKEFGFMTKNATCDITTIGSKPEYDYQISNIEGVTKPNFFGVKFDVTHNQNTEEYYLSIPGDFQARNALSAIACLKALGINDEYIKEGLETVSVKGRMEVVHVSDDYSLIIDYAYQGVALESIINTIRQTNPGSRIVTVFGCGGNRSIQRRYDMGRIAGSLSDVSIITSDNPRYEKPRDIINDILVEFNKTKGNGVVIEDRREAIKYALDNAQPGDVILLVGKGHEVYQEINGEKLPFDERVIIKDILSQKKTKKLVPKKDV